MLELQQIRRHRSNAWVVILIIFSIASNPYPQVASYIQPLRCIHRWGWREHQLLGARWTSSQLLHTKYLTDWDYKRLPSDFIVGLSDDAIYLQVQRDLDDDDDAAPSIA